jgi:hypothetical protein
MESGLAVLAITMRRLEGPTCDIACEGPTHKTHVGANLVALVHVRGQLAISHVRGQLTTSLQHTMWGPTWLASQEQSKHDRAILGLRSTAGDNRRGAVEPIR